MKFIEPSVEIIQQEPGINGMMKMIELAGRTAYKSEDRITEDSAKKFVKMLKQKEHGAALEHGTCYLAIPREVWNEIVDDHDFNFMDCPYQWFGYSEVINDYIHLTTNYRVLVEHGYESLLDGMVEPTAEDFENEIFKRRITVKFTCDRGVSHEFVRHRVFSFLQESTRYCNYSKDKFGGEITFIIPRWIHDIQEDIASTVDPLTYESRESLRKYQGKALMDMLCVYDRTVAQYVDTLSNIERCYLDMITLDDGTKLVPQQARQILPNCLKTELIMTGTIEQWKGFFKLRCATSAHPDARHLATQLEEKFRNAGYLN
jgi:thymidylate synthase (FAD)